MRTMVEHVHQQLKDKEVENAIDFTMGNGYDSLALSKIAKHVYSFDIQKEALENTERLLQGVTNVSLILDSHEHFDQYIQNFDIGIFNLGYLPNGDHSITTIPKTTISTLQKALHFLNPKGILYLVVYIGHESGQKESEQIKEYVQTLSHKNYHIAMFSMLHKKQAPYVIEIEKR